MSVRGLCVCPVCVDSCSHSTCWSQIYSFHWFSVWDKGRSWTITEYRASPKMCEIVHRMRPARLCLGCVRVFVFLWCAKNSKSLEVNHIHKNQLIVCLRHCFYYQTRTYASVCNIRSGNLIFRWHYLVTQLSCVCTSKWISVHYILLIRSIDVYETNPCDWIICRACWWDCIDSNCWKCS